MWVVVYFFAFHHLDPFVRKSDCTFQQRNESLSYDYQSLSSNRRRDVGEYSKQNPEHR